jgi:hypothetical protein
MLRQGKRRFQINEHAETLSRFLLTDTEVAASVTGVIFIDDFIRSASELIASAELAYSHVLRQDRVSDVPTIPRTNRKNPNRNRLDGRD